MSTHTPNHDVGPDETAIRPAAPSAHWDLPPAPPRPRRSRGPIIGAVVGTVLLVLGALYVIGYLMAGDNLPKNATVAGVAVGGLDRSQAIETLTTELGPRATAPIDVTVNGQASQVDPADAGLSIDYEASVDAAGAGRSLNPANIVAVLTGGGAHEAEISVDQAKLDAAAAALAGGVDRKPADAAVTYSGTKIKRTPAAAGVTLNAAGATDALRAGYLTTSAPIALPADVVEPEITDDEADQVVAGFAKPAVSAPVKVKAGGAGSFTVSRGMIADSVTFVGRDGTLVPDLDAKALRRAADAQVKKVELTKPRNANVRLVKGKPKVIAAVNGTAVSADALQAAVEPALTKAGSDRTVEVELSGAKAKFSTEDAKNLKIRRVTGQFTTYFPYLPYRNINIGRAAELINGTVLKPGDTFSLNGIVGERTRANGFTEGFIIKGGKFKRELGGGVSQSATTTYNAMFFAGLKDIQHQPHTLYIDRYPPGREATVAWPNLDLKFQNNTEYGVLVEASIVKGTPTRRGSITVKMWSTKTYDKITSTTPRKSNFTSGQDLKDDSSDCEPMTPVQGFDADYSRLFYRDGKVVKRENFHWRYAPTNKVTCT